MVSFPPAEAMKGWSAGEVRKNIVAPQVGYKAFSAFAKGRDWGYDPQNDKASSCLRKFIEAAE